MQPQARAALRRVWLKQEQARYRQRSQTQAGDINVWRQLGRICWELGEKEPALDAIDRALALQPDDHNLLLDRVLACLALNRYDEALAGTERMLALTSDDSEALLYRIDALKGLKRSAEGLAGCERLLALLDLPIQQRLKGLHNQVTFLFQLDRWDEALATVERALALAPGDFTFRLSRARLLRRLRRFAEALDEIEPLTGVPEKRLAALGIKACSLAGLGRFAEADAVLRLLREQYPHEALERQFEPRRLPGETLPDGLHKRYTARGLFLTQAYEAQKECDWTDWDAVLAQIDELAQDALQYGFVAGIEPFRLLSLPIDPALQLAVARARATAVEELIAPVRRNSRIEWPTRRPGERLRIGYVSGDFRNHATAHLIRKLFQVHDRKRFEIIGYSLRPGDGSRYWQDISQGCDGFVDLFGLGNAEAAARIAADHVHVLVDLHGYTRFARPEIFALRPAPVQVAFLGYPGTLGADYIPYIVADRVVLPETLRSSFSEQPVYLDCYQVNDDEQPIAATGLTRAAAGLPEGGFVFCCFNSPYKIEPAVFSVWMRILRQVPDSVLWLLAGTPRCIDHLRRAAQERGVEPERLVFGPRLPKPEHLERHRWADLFLDTFVYDAHTTASDALWAGVPVLTRPGTTFQSRVCASLLNALGLNELIVADDRAYENLALELARAPDRLRTMRARLRVRSRAGPPFATECFVRQLEQAFEAMWASHAAGRPPQSLHVPPFDPQQFGS
ncbi:MAG: glycosyltransferase [Candidatus Competibacteraceae bacterium]